MRCAPGFYPGAFFLCKFPPAFFAPAPVTPMLKKHQLELLSPARDVSIAKEAILHGADAVYIGGPGFGARHNASNSVADIAQLVEFAHIPRQSVRDAEHHSARR